MNQPRKTTLHRFFILGVTTILCLFMRVSAQHPTTLPGENGQKPAIQYDYFPSRQHAFVWRNWTLVPAEKLAKVLGTSKRNVERLAESMGLNRKQRIEEEWGTSRGYITIVRRNWHLLPYEQLLMLLNMSREELAYRLIEDDFLWTKLGKVKPKCEPLTYTEPDKHMQEKAARFAKDVQNYVQTAQYPSEPRFGFMRDFKKVKKNRKRETLSTVSDGFEFRMIFPYFTDYGDPLLDKDLSSYPEELFRQLSEVGVNGIWLHSVLRMMVQPDSVFPGDRLADKRIAGLKRLVSRAAKYGVKVYLYLNEPRAMDTSYFNGDTARMALAGPEVGGLRPFCTSQPEVRAWISNSLEQLFSQVKGLGGVFTITASENFTYCGSRGAAHQHCPLCRERDFASLAVELNKAIEEGVHRGNPDAKVIVWDWGWPDDQSERIITQLPKSCWFMSVSEWSLPIERGGVASQIGEYSISAVGPGPRAQRHWAIARQAGLRTVAKVQVNASWEMAVVPSVPALNLVAEHAKNLSSQHIQGIMLSWSLGGFPSENLKLFQNFRSGDNVEDALQRLAVSEYGEEATPTVREAWRLCSESYRQYPYHMVMLYKGPQHMGPSNPILSHPSGYNATMVGLPYDNLDGWRAVYPTDIWLQQMDLCAQGFQDGAQLLEKARDRVSGQFHNALDNEIRRMKTVYIHLKSGAEQGRFIDARNRLATANTETERQALRNIMKKALAAERSLIIQMLPLSSEDSSIAYESSNQYFYVPLDLIEALASISYAEREMTQ